MTVRPALLAAAALAASGICLAVCRWGAGGNATLSALAPGDLERLPPRPRPTLSRTGILVAEGDLP